ncbi:MAG: glycosyltransferase [Hyphomicrobiales bacterium]|nr:glycosyltransferase [Hyphomicrobiales bacterium]
MLISVVITNYNYGRFLSEAIESVLGQSHADVECLVVDDGSTDESRSVIEKYPAVRAIFKSNSGQAQSLKMGAAAARGEVIVSLDADDYLYPDACSTIAANWAPDLSCLNFRLKVDGQSFESWPVEPFLDSGQGAYLARYGYYPSAPMSGNAFAASYLRALLDRAEHLDGDGVDAYLLYSAPFCGRVSHVDRILGYYRTHGGNVSMTSGRKTVKNIGDHAYYQYWAQQNAARSAAASGAPFPSRDHLMGAYPLLWLLVAKDGGYTRKPLPAQSRWLTTRETLKAFAVQPGIPVWSRIKNIGIVAAMAPLPLGARRKLAQRFILV